jgi:hypothetical protein
MSDSGKSTKSTGDNATEEAPHVPFKLTWTVLSRFTDGEETPGNSGAPTLPVDADHSYHSHSINNHILTAI